MSKSPFDLENTEEFKRWRDKKLENYPVSINNIIVEIKDPLSLTDSEKSQLHLIISKTNSVIYTSKRELNDGNDILALGRQLGLMTVDRNPLSGEDAVSVITDKTSLLEELKAGEYIPYTSKAIQWHTDGYYNPPNEQIHGFILHCIQNAADGGENEFIDNEIVYLLLRERSSDFIKVLMEEDTFVIPANDDKKVTTRPESIGPVFSYSDKYGLHTRYTARKKNIYWQESDSTKVALFELETIINSQSKYHFYSKLEKSQGIITNNSLHRRNAFKDSELNPRRMFRARYIDRVKK